jgi:hypothetical protein
MLFTGNRELLPVCETQTDDLYGPRELATSTKTGNCLPQKKLTNNSSTKTSGERKFEPFTLPKFWFASQENKVFLDHDEQVEVKGFHENREDYFV